MGNGSRERLIALQIASSLFAAVASGGLAFGAVAQKIDLNAVRTEISSLERELLQSSETQISASGQLKKIRRLLTLQQKEIELSRAKISELSESMNALAAQKQTLLTNIDTQKAQLKRKLRELHKLTETDALDASWLSALDVDNQKSYFLSKTLKKELAAVENLKKDVQAALALELKILEEKNKLDYYVQELHGQMALLGANEQVQTEILKTNRSNRLEAMRRVKNLKDSEHELEKMIASFPERSRAAVAASLSAEASVELTLASLKGKLPAPVDGEVLSAFGKSFNPKTNLLTFQKGITLAARASADVKAVSAGKIVFSGPLKNYGLVVIVEHPGQYYTLYGQLGSVAVDLGKLIGQGEVVGRTNGEPLYFEIRNKNVAINPLQWLGNGSITLSKH